MTIDQITHDLLLSGNDFNFTPLLKSFSSFFANTVTLQGKSRILSLYSIAESGVLVKQDLLIFPCKIVSLS